ncbi:MAG: hypothetical protein GX241_07975 [Ruminococcaceae bacterium]|nr:hypothetical protein [Oscillospiraceae bacterium]
MSKISITHKTTIERIIKKLNEHFDELEEILADEIEENGSMEERVEYLDDAGEFIEKAIMRLEEAVRR